MTKYEQLCQIPFQENIAQKSFSQTNSFEKMKDLPAQIFMSTAKDMKKKDVNMTQLKQSAPQGDQLGCPDEERSN